MEHVYIHFPFCLKKCSYCDFYSLPADETLIKKYIEALCAEIKLQKKAYSGTLKTVFLGGGTPSLLTPALLEKILTSLSDLFGFSTKIEITLEANPETFTKEKFLNFKKAGINRISLGIQSLTDHELAYLGRVHSAEKAVTAAQEIAKIYDNFNIDLIYALPGQTSTSLLKTLTETIKLGPTHISFYELTFEQGTPLYKDKKPLTDENIIDLFKTGRDFLDKNNYLQYEISNYVRPGFECQHNLAYWSDKSYLGLGPAAHSYDKEKKQRKITAADLPAYLKKDFLSLYQYEEAKDIDALIMELRKIKGMPLKKFQKICGIKAGQLIDQGYLKITGENIALTNSGFLIMDKLLLELMA